MRFVMRAQIEVKVNVNVKGKQREIKKALQGILLLNSHVITVNACCTCFVDGPIFYLRFGSFYLTIIKGTVSRYLATL